MIVMKTWAPWSLILAFLIGWVAYDIVIEARSCRQKGGVYWHYRCFNGEVAK